MTGWADKETAAAEFGDQRLKKRLGTILERLSEKPSVSIPAACNGWNETLAAYRFFDNESVTAEKVLSAHLSATLERIGEQEVVLLIQDTTELDYTGKKETKGLGTLTYESQLGLLLHPNLAVTPERICLGVVDSRIWGRPLEQRGKKVMRKQKPIEEKESFRWIEGYRKACEIAKEVPQTKIVSIMDREADIYELFVEEQSQGKGKKAEYVVRSSQDRLLKSDEQKNPDNKIWSRVSKAPILGTIEFQLPATKERKARVVTQTLRASRLELRPPQRKGFKLAEVKITAILASEEDPPKGVEPVEWVLLTSLPVERFEQAVEILQWYLCRWEIEIYFRILKSGCKVEELQLENTDRLKPCLALYMIIAWRILYMTMIGRSYPNLPCDVIFDEEEWKAVYVVVKRAPPPTQAPPLAMMIKMIAGLGGFLNRKHDGQPGPQTIWIGLQRTKDFVLAIHAHSSLGMTYV